MFAPRLAALAMCVALSLPALAAAQGANPAGSPSASFAGRWKGSSDPNQDFLLYIQPTGSSTVDIFAERRYYEAQGFVRDSSTVIALARTTWRGEDNTPPTRYFILWFERANATTLRTWTSHSLEDPRKEGETWTYVGPLDERRVEPRTEPAPSSDEEITAVGAPDGPGFYDPPYVEQLPQAETRTEPVYPDDARRAGVEGTVLVQVLVGKDGFVRDARVTKSIPLLDAAAVACVRSWRFKPGLSNHRPVPVWIAIPVRFKLR